MTPLTLELDGDRHVLVRRHFSAPPELVYRAHVEPDLIRQWMLGPPGWSMPSCEADARAGGSFRFVWANEEGATFSITGEYLELEPHARIVHVERMHMPDPTPDNHIETRFENDAGGTLMTMRMTLPDEPTRNAMLETGMEHGMEASYARLDGLELA